MTEPKSFKRGRHTYTRWGSKFKEVRIEGKGKIEKKEETSPVNMTMNVDAQTALGVYSNFTMVHRSPDEAVLDFLFLPPGKNQGRVRSRVIIPLKEVHKLAQLFQKASDEIQLAERKSS